MAIRSKAIDDSPLVRARALPRTVTTPGDDATAPSGSPALPALPRVLVPHPHIRSDSRMLGGSPHVVGSRVPVRRLWAWHQAGATLERLLRRYPSLGPGKLLDALAFAYDNPDVIDADLARESAVLLAAGKRPEIPARATQQAFAFMAGDEPA